MDNMHIEACEGPRVPFVDFTFGLKSELKSKVWFLKLGGVFSWVEVHKILWESTVPFDY
jgi:hypothetical protein